MRVRLDNFEQDVCTVIGQTKDPGALKKHSIGKRKGHILRAVSEELRRAECAPLSFVEGFMPEQNTPYWLLLFYDFIAETEPARLQARLDTLEEALVLRWRESDPVADFKERLALQTATDRLLEIKIDKLGFPPLEKIS
jgi:hypothetical protein